MYATIHWELLDSIEHLDEDTKARVIYACVVYQIDWVEPPQNDLIVYSIFKAKQFDLDSTVRRAVANIENGKKGWRPKKTFQNPTKTQNNPNVTHKNHEHEKEKENEKEHENEHIQDNSNTMCNKLHAEWVKFSEFWSKYPNKKDKKKAQDKFNKLSEQNKQLAIDWIDKLMKSDSWQRWYIPMPTTYINWQRREDEVILPKKDVTKAELLARERDRIKRDLDHNTKQNATNSSTTFDRRTDLSGDGLLW